MEDVLNLNKKDADNYQALVRVILNEPISPMNGRRRLDNERLRGSLKLAMLSEQNYQCKDCNKIFRDFSKATGDHIIPWRFGALEVECAGTIQLLYVKNAIESGTESSA